VEVVKADSAHVPLHVNPFTAPVRYVIRYEEPVGMGWNTCSIRQSQFSPIKRGTGKGRNIICDAISGLEHRRAQIMVYQLLRDWKGDYNEFSASIQPVYLVPLRVLDEGVGQQEKGNRGEPDEV
jgi:hypothetical protein